MPLSQTFHSRPLPADEAAIQRAARILRAGGLVGMPTETVYGLAADAGNALAVAAIYEAKGRPRFNPLISHVADVAQARACGVFNQDAEKLAAAFWPGPLTLVLPYRGGSAISDLARAGLDTVALRVPAHPVALALIAAAGKPLAAPSANVAGRISPTTAADVQAELGDRVGLILDGGPCSVGLESTVVACSGNDVVILRPGGVARESLEAVVGRRLSAPATGGVLRAPGGVLRAPGMMLSHYAPVAPVQINMVKFGSDDAILAFGSSGFDERTACQPYINLSPTGDLREAAARLFSALRELDAFSPVVISVAPIPRSGLGEAINDRLERAAAPRQNPRRD
jgi:L-threonylcarbamoyladenylate synthase